MELNFKKILTLIFVITLLFSGQAVFAQSFPLSIQVQIAPPYPTHVSDFTGTEGSVFVTVNNPTQHTYRIFLTGTLRNVDRGITISTDPSAPPGECIDITPGLHSFTGTDLSELFDPDRLVYTGTSIDIIRGDQALPEGTYTLCLRAESCEQRGVFYSPVAGDEGCASFDVAFVEPPEITAPECGSEVDLSAGNITMQWQFVPPAGGMGSIRFRIEMVELDPISRDPRESMNSSPRIFNVDDIEITSYNLLIGTDVTLTEGRTYVFRVVAYDPDEIVQFQNNGESDICTFQYGEATGTVDHPAIIVEYPLNSDRIPFDFFPMVVRFDPYSFHYKHFSSDMSLLTSSGFFDENQEDLNWPSGPLISQRNITGIFEMSEDQSTYQAIYKTKNESRPAFSKGKDYTWNTDVVMRWNTTDITIPRVTSSFSLGMGPSQLSLPEDGDTVAPGSINFQWLTANAPRKIMPDFAIVHVTRDSTSPHNPDSSDYFDGNVDERWKIEISTSHSFDSIVEQRSSRLGANINIHSSDEAVISEVYKNVEEDFNITKKGKYYWRVKWMNSPGNADDNAFYEVSDIHAFVIDSVGSGGGGSSTTGTTTGADTTGGCISVCLAPPITDRTAILGLVVGNSLKIGKFTMVVETLEPPSGSRFSGEGYVQIPFMNNVKILVGFHAIQYNAENQIFSGTVQAKEDPGGHFPYEDVITALGTVVPSMSGVAAEGLSSFLTDYDRLVSGFTGASAIGMPIGIDREIAGNRYTVGIVDMTFTPERATMNAVMNLNFPELGNTLIAYGAKDLCITPTGLGDEARLYLARDNDIANDGETRFTFKGGTDTAQSCYLSMDCHGFLCARIHGEVVFPRNMLVPDNADGTIGAGNVTGSFSVKTCRGGNFIASINFEPFQIKGVDGWGFSADNAWLDYSDLENPPGFDFPASYADTALLNGDSRMQATWHGFFMKNLGVRTPAQFEDNRTSDRISFDVLNTIIDGTGFTSSINVTGILPLEHGSFKGWGISLDTVNIDFVSNVFRDGGISGKFRMPIFGSNESMNYRMALTYDDDKLNYLCRVFTTDSLTVNMWAARLLLRPDCEIRLQAGDSSYAYANLSGDLSINGDVIPGGEVPGIHFKGVAFEGLTLQTSAPWFGIDSVYFSYASPQKSVAGFPVSINHIKVNMNEPLRPGIDFDLDIVLSNFSAHGKFGIFGRLGFEGGNLTAGYDGIDVEGISINQTVSSVKLMGSLDFYKNDVTYGNGLKGKIAVTIPMDISASLTVQFGTKNTNPAAAYGTADNYAYWFVDGLVTFPTGFPIFSGFGIYGFGGGVFNNMIIDPSTSLPSAASTLTPGSDRTSVKYIPTFGNFGLKLSAVMGTQPSSTAFNMDASLTATFNTITGGLDQIEISAAGYIMAPISDRGESKIWANVRMGYYISGGEARFDGNFDVYVNVNGKLTGRISDKRFVEATIHFDRETWFFYMGTLAAPGELNLVLPALGAHLKTYLMVGHGIPPELPPPPPAVVAILYGDRTSGLGNEDAITAHIDSESRGEDDQGIYKSASGFAFGVSFDYHQEMDFAIFYANLRLILGFDLNVTKDRNRICAETGDAPGVHNWYSTGQVYAALIGEMGVKVDLWFIKGKYPFINLSAAMLLQGGMPNPDWFTGRAALAYSVLGGLLEGRCSFAVNVGERCTMVSSDPLGDLEFIYDVRPKAEDSPVSVFELPRVTFNLPVEKMLIFPVGTEAHPLLIRKIKPYIASYKLMINDGRNIVVPGTFEMSENNTIATYNYEEALESTTTYKIEIVVHAKEYFDDGSIQDIVKDGRLWEERRVETFTTQLRPAKITSGNVTFTYPVENQRFFLKGETKKGVGGLIKFDRTVGYLFYTTNETGHSFVYLVRFKAIPDGEPIDVPLLVHSGYIDFVVPSLENDKMYTIRVIRKPIQTREEQIAADLGGTSRISPGGATFNTNSTALSPLRFVIDSSTVNIKREGKQLNGTVLANRETVLYNYCFKTSKFNSLREKLNAANVLAEYEDIWVAEFLLLRTSIPEPFDDFEFHGVFKNGVQVLKPLLGVTAPFEYNYHTTQANPNIYTLLQDMQNYMATAPFHLGAPTVTGLNSHGKGKPPINSVSFGNAYIAPPLSNEDIEAASGIVREGGTTYTTAIGNTSLTNLLNGAGTTHTTPGSFSVSSLAGTVTTDPSNFHLNYETSNYVIMDFSTLKRNVSRILSYTVGGVPVYYNAMRRNNPALLERCNQMMRKPIAYFKLTPGEYGIDMFYRVPTPTGNATSTGNPLTKTFSYGAPTLIIPSLIRPR